MPSPKRSSRFVGYRADGSVLELPTLTYKGGSGPSVFLGITLHGDELTGQASFWKLRPFLEFMEMHGTLTVFPVMNPEGLNASTRGISLGCADTNRVFPGNPEGTLGERIAHIIFSQARQADYVLDLHTAGDSIPFILLDETQDSALAATAQEMAVASGLSVIHEYPSQAFLAHSLDKSFTAQAMKEGIPSMVIELGGGPLIHSPHADIGYTALTNVLVHLTLLDCPPFPVRPLVPGTDHYRTDVRTPRGGLLDYQIGLGQKVTAGATLAYLRDQYGEMAHSICSPKDGYLLYRHHLSVIQPGGFVAGLAVKKTTQGTSTES